MTFLFAGATAAQKARSQLARAGIGSIIRKSFGKSTGCRFLVIVSERDAAAARRILGGGSE